MQPQLSQRREQLLRITRALVPKNRPLTPSERQTLATVHQEMLELETEIHSDAERRASESFDAWLRLGLRPTPHTVGVTAEQRDALSTLEYRDMAGGGLAAGMTGASGGALFVPEQFDNMVTSAMRDTGPMLRVSTVLPTPSGTPFFHPFDNDTSVSGELMPEGEQASDIDPALVGVTQLGAFKYGSRMVKVSIEFLQDSPINIPAWLAERFGVRLARAINPHLTTGTGSGQPLGLLNAATQGAVAVGSSPNDGSGAGTNTVGQQDLENLIASVDVLYRNSPNAAFILNDSTLTGIKKLTDKQGLPLHLYKSALENASGVATLCGYRCETNPSMPTLQVSPSSPPVSVRSVLFGDLSKYKVRRTPYVVHRFNEKYIDQSQIGFLLVCRLDAALIDGGGGAVKYLSNVY